MAVSARVPEAVGAVDLAAVTERERWNRLVTALPGCALEQGYEWGEVLRSSGGRPYRYAVFQGDRCLAAAAMLAWSLPFVRASVLYASRGPLVRADADTGWTGLVAAARDVARATQAVCLRVSPAVPLPGREVHEQLTRHGFVRLAEAWTVWNAPSIVMVLELDGDEDVLWRRISNTRRREIRVAEQAGVVVDRARSGRDLDDFYELVRAMGARKRYPVRRLRHFAALWRAYGETGDGVLALARHRGRTVGGLLGARLGDRAYLLYSAVDPDHLPGQARTHPGPILYWHFIRWARAAGCRTIHWGGSGTRWPPSASDPGYGVYQFKRSYGSTCLAYLGYYDLVFRPALYVAFRAVERRLGGLLWRLRARLNR